MGRRRHRCQAGAYCPLTAPSLSLYCRLLPRYRAHLTMDLEQALGVWLLGPPGWRRLDIILPEHRWTLAAENDEVRG